MGTLLEHGQMLIDAGYRVFPVSWETKKPLVPWSRYCSNEQDQLLEWHRVWPQSSVGFPMALNGLVALDIDVHPGKPNGYETWSKFLNGREIPVTSHQQTPSGGAHIIFKNTSYPLISPGPGIDIRQNAYIKVYDPESILYYNVIKVPAWMRKELRGADPIQLSLRPESVAMTPELLRFVSCPACDNSDVDRSARDFAICKELFKIYNPNQVFYLLTKYGFTGKIFEKRGRSRYQYATTTITNAYNSFLQYRNIVSL